ncbi:MAG: hypothetical protein IJ724_11515 [Muribaculaceae bacterium]|nr:hypothetical protein [Muribaculaceae bacterium]
MAEKPRTKSTKKTLPFVGADGTGVPSLHGPFMLPGVPAATKNERQKAIVRYEKWRIRFNLYKNQEKVSLR